MDDLGGLIIGLIAIGLVLVVVFYILWILVATLLRLLAWLLAYTMVATSLTFVAGVATGLIVPLRVLRGRAAIKPVIAYPGEVAAGRVMLTAPPGGSAFPWDRAWPLYNPYQARRDAAAVRREVSRVVGLVWRKVRGKVALPSISIKGSGAKRLGSLSKSFFGSVPGTIWLLFVPVPFAGFLAGAWLSFGVWFSLMFLLGGGIYLCQQAWMLGRRWLDRGQRRRARQSMVCPHDYRQTTTPSFRCSNPACTEVHRDISPGALGVIVRRCVCGQALPTGVLAAAKVLQPICPYCDRALASGSGARLTLQVPAFGAVAAGKTRLFEAGLVEMARALTANGGKVEPLGISSEAFASSAEAVITGRAATTKTPEGAQPVGQPMMLTTGAGQVIELQLLDAAGERFASWHSTEDLTYFNSAGSLIAVLDPLAFGTVRPQTRRYRAARGVLVATGDQEDAYSSVVDRLEAQSVRLNRMHLAVVLTKADILTALPCGRDLDAGSSAGIRAWIEAQGEDGLVAHIERDFRDVRYFAVDSMTERDPHDPFNPIHVFQWVLDSQGIKFTLVPELPELDETSSQTKEAAPA
ncbi:MAG: hypothetical protein LBJ62_10575 [Bifidobacteriaceae bacterium]|jgi:hypothetical protein|nr:hypothetical protein [Bifidobacteriaceae bacterium]